MVLSSTITIYTPIQCYFWLERHFNWNTTVLPFLGQKRSFLDKNRAKFEYNVRLEPLYFNRTPVFYWRGYGNQRKWRFSEQFNFDLVHCVKSIVSIPIVMLSLAVQALLYKKLRFITASSISGCHNFLGIYRNLFSSRPQGHNMYW